MFRFYDGIETGKVISNTDKTKNYIYYDNNLLIQYGTLIKETTLSPGGYIDENITLLRSFYSDRVAFNTIYTIILSLESESTNIKYQLQVIEKIDSAFRIRLDNIDNTGRYSIANPKIHWLAIGV